MLDGVSSRRRVCLLDVHDLHIAASGVGLALIVTGAGIAAFVAIQYTFGAGNRRISQPLGRFAGRLFFRQVQVAQVWVRRS